MRLILTLLLGFILYSGSVYADPFAYVTIPDQNEVSVIDVSTNLQIATVDVGMEPVAAASSIDGMLIFVANASSNDISVIEVSSNTVVDTINVGNRPIAIAVTPDGEFAYVVNSDDNTVSIIQLLNNSIVETVTVGPNPSAIAIARNTPVLLSGFAYVTNRDNNTISIIDTTSMEVVDTLEDAGQEPVAIALLPDNSFAFVGDVNSDSITTFNLLSRETNPPIDLSDGMNSGRVGCMQMNSVGELFLTWANQTIVIDGGFEFGERINVDGVCLAIAPGNNPTYVTNNGDSNVSIIEGAEMFVGTIAVSGLPQGIAITGSVFGEVEDEVAMVPTLNQWGLIATAGVLGIIGILAIRRKKAAT